MFHIFSRESSHQTHKSFSTVSNHFQHVFTMFFPLNFPPSSIPPCCFHCHPKSYQTFIHNQQRVLPTNAKIHSNPNVRFTSNFRHPRLLMNRKFPQFFISKLKNSSDAFIHHNFNNLCNKTS